MIAPPFRQLVRPGEKGLDVLAYHRALRKMGYRRVLLSRTAGPQFCDAVRHVQRDHGLRSDGIIGEKTHRIVGAHFDAYGAKLYRTARIRKPPAPTSAQAAAKRLLELSRAGKYRADNPGDLRDIEAAALGHQVWSRGGRWVKIDARPLEMLVWLIDEMGYRVGTFALCSDHHFDGWKGHAGGYATDISSIDGVSIGSGSEIARILTARVAGMIRYGRLRPWQLICDGYGGRHDPTIAALTIPSAGFYGSSTMAGHRNHIHVGYEPGRLARLAAAIRRPLATVRGRTT